MSQKIYLNILKIGVYISLLSVFLVFKNLLFPYITSKQISFNILIEILFVIWLAFIIKYPEYSPFSKTRGGFSKSGITIGLISFFIALIISCFISVDFNLSFWGDIERMLGVFHLLHFLAFYFIIITVFREWKDWKVFFIVSIIFAVFVSFKGLTGGKAYSTIGNTAYVSGYLIFNIYFSLILFFREKSKMLRWLYFLPLPIMLLEFLKANTTGAYVGLGFSIMILLLLYGILNKNKIVKISSVFLLILSVLLVIFVFNNRGSEIVKKYPIIRLIESINIKKNTFQTRLISWRAAAKDFKNHPIFGTGHGNYAIIFDKYFDPKFYDYTRSETYFDRAHNNLIDIASTAGLVGLLTYLSIFIAAGYYLIRSYLKNYIVLHDFILIICLIIAYFVQNLVVFDSLVTYISIMMVLAFIYWFNRKGEEGVEIEARGKAGKEEEYIAKDRGLENKEIYALVFAGAILLIIMYQFNIKPLKMLIGTIDGQRAYAQGKLEETVEIYKKALSYNTVLDRDSRTSLIRLIIENPYALDKIDKEKAQGILDYTIKLAEINVNYNIQDSLDQMLLSQILDNAANFNFGNSEKAAYYSGRALEAVDKSIEASPGRVPIYYLKAQIYLTQGQTDKAIETLKYAYSLNEKYYDSACQLARVLLYYNQEEEGFKYMDQCIDLGGLKLISPANLVKSLINRYVDQKDWPKVIKLYERLTQLEPKEVKDWVNLATLYAENGDKEKAKEAVDKAVEIDPTIKNYANEFMNKIK